MGFRVSPGVSITEKDLTAIIPAVASTPGGFAGYFHWGPGNEVITVTNQTELVNIFGKPDTSNYVDFFSVANFLGYGNNCGVVRALGATAYNATCTVTGVTAFATAQIPNATSFATSVLVNTTLPSLPLPALFASKYPGVLGNSIQCAVVSGAGTTGASLAYQATAGATFLRMYVGSTSEARSFSVGDLITFNDGTSATLNGVQRVIGSSAAPTSVGVTAAFRNFFGVTSGWDMILPAGPTFGYLNLFVDGGIPVTQSAGAAMTIKSAYARQVSTTATSTSDAVSKGGSNDLINIVISDKLGSWTGVAGSVIEKFEGVSRASDAVNSDGSSNYWKTVINNQSEYIWALPVDLGSSSGTAQLASATFGNLSAITSVSKSNSLVNTNVLCVNLDGASNTAPTDSERYTNGWMNFANPDEVDVSLMPLGEASSTLATMIIQNIVEPRKDCMAFASPSAASVVNALPYAALNNIKTYRENSLNINSSYAVLDSGWKLQLDTYNNVVRAMPLNPDIAGLVARTEFTNDAWFSPAGFNRGQIKNVVKLPYNPSSEAHRDELYQKQVNPVVSFPGQGTILFGDKTMQTRPSAFDRINVRRLFIVLEKTIAIASKFFLFEQNDQFTRVQFKNLVVPFLRTVQQRRGITDFLVVCDDTNNTGEVIDRNEFVADIYIKPTRSINFIQLNFIATRTGVNFSEVVGA